MQDFSAQFPVIQDYTYLNTASCGLLSKDLVDWRNDHDRRLMEGGSLFRDLHKAHIRGIRHSVADFFSTSESNVALVPNFSFGWNTLLDGIAKDKKVLLLKGDYPSVNWPVEHRKFETCYAQLDEHLEQNIAAAFETHQPDILALSVVQYISGLKVDLDFFHVVSPVQLHLQLRIGAFGVACTCSAAPCIGSSALVSTCPTISGSPVGIAIPQI